MPQNRTPLRYPGGKQKLTPFVLEIIQANGLEGGHYAEPYAGGAGVAMELLVEGHVKHVHLNDSSYHIYCFWHSCINYPSEFCSKISRSLLNVDEWKEHREILRHPERHSVLEVGFATFYLNRTNRSGVLGGGVIGGIEQQGAWKIDARFPRNELISRIELIASLKKSITVCNLDAEKFFLDHVPKLPSKTLVYCDPPYFEKADRLYLNHYKADDHERIARIIQNLSNVKWMVSYDGVDQILSYYQSRRKFLYELQYNASRAYKGNEVFIFADDLVIPRKSKLPYIAKALELNTNHLHRFGSD
ncbi:DNA adenine methylase [Variovorax boronicumulans]|uniref:DNA adenine methylase n=1 Tax=Variovorax boronicumulans TaxID=436515 RepID=UPI002780AF03|nr:DNA adenine methylase [Variovorax boronicumulans]MDQ0037877.1 DNA adenine methylase [Variovorax boronicumulans]